MAQKDYEKEIQGIRTDTEKIKREIMKLEFQHKKDLANAQKEFQKARRDFEKRDEQIQMRIDYIAKLAGITYEELDLLELKLQETGRVLTRPREHAKR